MALKDYEYQAVTADGKPASGNMAGESDREVVLKLHKRGLVPISVYPAGAGAPAAVSRPDAPLRSSKQPSRMQTAGYEFSKKLAIARLGRVKLKDLIAFAENLAVLLDSGISLDKALSILRSVTASRRFEGVIADVHNRVREGESLGDAVAAHPKIFPPVFVGMVAAGEQGGILESVLKKLAEYLAGVQEVREYLISAMIYPAVLTLTSAASMVVLVAFVVPRFSTIFQDLGVAMPLPTRILMTVGNFMQNWWWTLLLALLAALLAFRSFSRTPRGRRAIDTAKLRSPIIGSIFIKIETARLANTLGTLLSHGVPILAALNMVRDAVQNTVFKKDLGGVYDDLKEGRLLSHALADIPYFPAQAREMIGVGEETGRLDALLAKVAEIYEKDLKVAVKSFTALIEPVVILVMGLAIGAMVVSMLMAIFSVNTVQL